ncbi:MAG: hypothetical protein ABW033_07520 [Acidimicrobiia bacterium]
MRRFVVSAVVAVTVGALGPAAEANDHSGTLEPAEMTDALIEVEDLPPLDFPGFVEWQNEPLETPSPVGRCNGPNADARALRTGSSTHGNVAFVTNPPGVGAAEAIYVFPSSRKASTFVVRSKAAALSCTTTEISDPVTGNVTTIAASRLPTMPIGDQRFAIQDRTTRTLAGQSPLEPERWVADVAYVRENNAVIVIGAGGSEVDPPTFDSIVARAWFRLKLAAS